MDVDSRRGFIQCEKQGKSLFELGESYFNELINRSMIQALYILGYMVCGCRVHDMVLDLICSLSSEANFVTILNGKDQVSPSSKIRRLSIQNGKEDNSMTLATRSLQQVRSVIVLRSATSQIPVLRPVSMEFHGGFHAQLIRCHVSFCMKLGGERRDSFHGHETYPHCFQNFGNTVKPALRPFLRFIATFLLRDHAGKRGMIGIGGTCE